MMMAGARKMMASPDFAVETVMLAATSIFSVASTVVRPAASVVFAV